MILERFFTSNLEANFYCVTEKCRRQTWPTPRVGPEAVVVDLSSLIPSSGLLEQTTEIGATLRLFAPHPLHFSPNTSLPVYRITHVTFPIYRSSLTRTLAAVAPLRVTAKVKRSIITRAGVQ